MEMRTQISRHRILVCLLAIIVGFSMLIQTGRVSAAETGETTGPFYYDGEYEGTAYGYRSDIIVKITITDHRIAGIQIVSQAEDGAYWKKALKMLPAIEESGSLDVDTISGATISCKGILAAAANALELAKSDPGSPFLSGDGSEESPWVIATPAKLVQFAETVDAGSADAETGIGGDYTGKYIKLGADMDLTQLGSWDPIGGEASDATNLFNGNFDGAGHVISGMSISGKYEDGSYVGFFSRLGEAASLKDLHLEQAEINVKAKGSVYAGLLAGATSDAGAAVIDNCSAQGKLTAKSSAAGISVAGGGLLGLTKAASIVSNCWADVSLEAAAQGKNSLAYAGGLTGGADDGVLVVNNAATGEVTANAPAASAVDNAYAGGLAGFLDGKWYNNYAAAGINLVTGRSGETLAGALAGEAALSKDMTEEGGNYVYPAAGALRANNVYASDIAVTAYADGEDVSKAAAAAGRASDPLFTGMAVTAAQMQEEDFADLMDDSIPDTAALLQAYGLSAQMNHWKSENGFCIPMGKVWKGQPATSTVNPAFASGKGTKKNPYVIMTGDQLRAFAASVTAENNYEKEYIRLGADIDVSGSEWTPVGGVFNGSFDGAGFTVKGMTIGSPDAAKEVEGGVYGFFAQLGAKAYVKDLHLTDVMMNISSSAGIRSGGMSGIAASGSVIDGCSVTGTMKAENTKGNAFEGGLVAYGSGAIINSMTDIDMVSANSGNWIETGGIIGLNNGGLVANSYSLTDVETIAGEDNQGYSMASNIAGYQGGDVVNCYADGSMTTNDKTDYSGILAGWMRGAARVYNSWYNKEQSQVFGGQKQDPLVLIGVWPSPYPDKNDEFYLGGLVDEVNGFTPATKKALAANLNGTLEAFPVDVTEYGVAESAMRTWAYDEAAGAVTLSDEPAEFSYLRPDCETIQHKEDVLKSGIWYGRDKAKTSIVAITVSDNEVTGVEILEGKSSGDAYDEAVAKAREKALYGDTSSYKEADPSMFAGGSGTAEDPYQIANEAQLRYLAESINEDVDWEGCYFKQTANIRLTQGDWIPIGWGIMAEVKHRTTVYAQYPFCGNYDGGNYTISGLTIGSADQPSVDPRCSLMAGLFGFVAGEEQTNDTPQDPNTRYVDLTNIHLQDVSIHVAAPYDIYAGALAADAEMGFHAVNCSAEGSIDVVSSDGSAYTGGMLGYPVMGLLSNSWTNIKLSAKAENGSVYAGGLCGNDIRVTTVNSFAAGDVIANGKSTTYAGGLSGQFAGFRYNCYTSSAVTADSEEANVGAVNGTVAGIGAETGVYYSEAADLTVAGNKAEVKANGNTFAARAQCGEEAQKDMGQGLSKLLTENTAQAAEQLKALYDEFHGINHHGHGMYYAGDGSDLSQWAVNGIGVVAFAEAKQTPGGAISDAAELLNNLDKLTLEDAAAVAAARNSYDSMSEAQKAALPGDFVKALEQAEKKLAELKEADAADADAAQTVEALINALPQASQMTAEDMAKAAEVKKAYDALTDAQKAKISAQAADKLYNVSTTAALAAAEQKLQNNDESKALKAKVAQLTVRAQTVSKLKAKAKKGKKAVISWKSLGKGYTYLVYSSLSPDKGFKKVAKTTKKSVTVKKLKKSKTYYVKVRAYKKVSGKTVYTGYSTIVKFKATKK